MNFVADESVERQIVAKLREIGHNVLYIAEMEPGITDDIVLSRANTNNSILVTVDKDFGELVFRQKQINAGVILLRFAGLSLERKVALVETSIQAHLTEIPNSFTVISRGSIRIRPQS